MGEVPQMDSLTEMALENSRVADALADIRRIYGVLQRTEVLQPVHLFGRLRRLVDQAGSAVTGLSRLDGREIAVELGAVALALMLLHPDPAPTPPLAERQVLAASKPMPGSRADS